jgi:hypothetical protein
MNNIAERMVQAFVIIPGIITDHHASIEINYPVKVPCLEYCSIYRVPQIHDDAPKPFHVEDDNLSQLVTRESPRRERL